MQRTMLAALSLVALAACEDAATSPRSIAPELPSADVSPAALSHHFAKVDLNGTLLRGNNVTAVNKLSTGIYEVTFNTSMANCAYVATTENIYSQAVQAYTASGHLSASGVYVETKNQGGGLTDGTFNLVATCGATGIRYAVIGYNDDLVRSTPGTTLQPLGSGRYNLQFAAPASDCAYLGTVADPGNGLVFSPSGVYTASGPNANSVYIETKNPGGGLQAGVPFHIALVCNTLGRTRYAVVRRTGVIARASVGTTITKPGIGTFQVNTNRSLSTCATINTRGSVNQAVPFNPATMETTAGVGPNSVGIQVRELLFFGGNLTDQAFHTASVC